MSSKIQELIDKIRGKNIIGRDFINFSGKQKSFLENLNNIEILALGSSHGQYAFMPKNPSEFNLCSPSQDLYYSYMLYNKYKNQLPKLNTIILFYSIFSAGFCLEKASEKYRCVHFKFLFDINPKEFFLKLRTNLIAVYYGYFLKNNYKKAKIVEFGKNPDFDGKCVGRQNPIGGGGKRRAWLHLKQLTRECGQDVWVNKLYQAFCRNDNQQMYIVIPPFHNEYRKALPEFDVLFESLINTCKDKNIKIINLFDNKSFIDDDFFDYDHLNLKGSEKFTKMLKDEMFVVNNK